MNGLTASYIVAIILLASAPWFVDSLPLIDASENEVYGGDSSRCDCDCKKRNENDVEEIGRMRVILSITEQHPFDHGVTWQACNPEKNITVGEVISCEGLQIKMVIDFNEEGNGLVLSWAPQY